MTDKMLKIKFTIKSAKTIINIIASVTDKNFTPFFRINTYIHKHHSLPKEASAIKLRCSFILALFIHCKFFIFSKFRKNKKSNS